MSRVMWLGLFAAACAASTQGLEIIAQLNLFNSNGCTGTPNSLKLIAGNSNATSICNNVVIDDDVNEVFKIVCDQALNSWQSYQFSDVDLCESSDIHVISTHTSGTNCGCFSSKFGSSRVYAQVSCGIVCAAAPQVISSGHLTLLGTSPSAAPTPAPTIAPSKQPTRSPTVSPTQQPTPLPSVSPTKLPTPFPSVLPTAEPTPLPSIAPTKLPTPRPSFLPTLHPTPVPSTTHVPTQQPTRLPTMLPTFNPTIAPSQLPTLRPSAVPTKPPTFSPSVAPTRKPSPTPTVEPTHRPTAAPTTAKPTTQPIPLPTSAPTLMSQVFVYDQVSDCSVMGGGDSEMYRTSASVDTSPCQQNLRMGGDTYDFQVMCSADGSWELILYYSQTYCASYYPIAATFSASQSCGCGFAVMPNGYVSSMIVNCNAVMTTCSVYTGPPGYILVWFIYVAYFAAFCVITMLIDISTAFDGRVKMLGDSAFESFKRFAVLQVHEESMKRGVSDVERSLSIDTINSSGERERNENSEKCMQTFCCVFPDEGYSDSFFSHILKGKCYFGCAALVYEQGMRMGQFQFAPGFMEDMIFYLSNNHIIGSMFCATRGNPFSRSGRRIAFFGQNCFALFAQTFINFLGGRSFTATQISLINIFVIAPLSNVVNSFFYYMLVCPCASSYMHHKEVGCYANCVKYMGNLIAYPAALSGILLLLVASFIAQNASTPQSSEDDSGLTIARFAWSVHIIASVYDVLGCLKKFLLGTSSTCLKVCGLTVFEYGEWYSQKMSLEKKQEGVDFVSKKTDILGVIVWEVLVDPVFLKQVESKSVEMANVATNALHSI